MATATKTASKWITTPIGQPWQEAINSIRHTKDGNCTVNGHYSNAKPGENDRYVSLQKASITDGTETREVINVQGFSANSGLSATDKISTLRNFADQNPTAAMAMAELLKSL